VNFADGATAIVAFGRQNPARIEIVLRAWALLYQREVRQWERTSLPAEFFYDGQKRHMCRFDAPRYHDFLSDLLPLAALKDCPRR
jgi:hypothetical protein